MQATSANPGAAGGAKEDLRNDITILEPQESPLLSTLEKRSEISNMLVETLSDRFRPARTDGFKEGEAGGAGANQSIKRGRFGVYPHKAKDEWAVTRETNILAKRGGQAGITNLADHERMRTVAQVKRDLECVVSGDQETQSGNGGAAEMKTRGAFKWITPAGTALSPEVATDFRPGSGNVVTHGQATPQLFTEQTYFRLLKAISREHGGKKNYFQPSGDGVVETVAWFSRIVGTSTSTAYNVTMPNKDAKVELQVDIYDCAFGRVDVVPSQFIKWNNTTKVPDYNSALVLFMELWYFDQLEEVNEAEYWNNAGGEGGCIQASGALVCKSPRGNGKIIQA